MGLNSRELSPGLVKKIVSAGAQCRSEKVTQTVLRSVGNCEVSIKAIERVLHEVGSELKELWDCPPSRLPKSLVPPSPAEPPKLAVVMVDGGRMMTRQPGHGSGVHEQAWRETKNASLESMTHQTHTEDPRPELPACFADPKHVAEIAGTAALPVSAAVAVKGNDAVETTDEVGVTEADEEAAATTVAPIAAVAATDEVRTTAAAAGVATADAPRKADDASRGNDAPRRLVRTCLSSLDRASDFGRQMNREAKRRRLDQASHKAFLADGLAANWTLWQKHFRHFEPILDFMHAVEYVYEAAAVIHAHDPQAAWDGYLRWARLCWSGRVREVIPELLSWLTNHGLKPDQTLEDKHPHKAVHDAHRYLTNNASRMDYARYRQAGLPVTSAPMESLVKQINLRVKGTEMFWNDGRQGGGEAILQIRAASLSDDGRLETYLNHRPGSPFVRRSSQKSFNTLNC